MGFNNWLREEAEEQQGILRKNTARLQAQLSVLLSVLQQEEISLGRYRRVSRAMTHLMSEIHLLVILTEEK